ncbi:hypothetical protein [Vibrio fluvialis]|uniref:hypothetical protein n=1 Tax=Vibrio fluvialis TaxID=676 RepID=UPI0023A973F5|nr:hypothetical protein [Vibrio fluvialis]MDE5179015.1 hypothetical protein [Vibrio fluvialis]
MHTKNKLGVVILAIALFSNSVGAQIMTVAEFEQKQIDIMNSDLESQAKIEQINKLSALFDATQALKHKIDAAKAETKSAVKENPAEKSTAEQAAPKQASHVDSKLAASNELKNQLEQKILDEVFLIELGVIGPIGKAEIIAQSRKYPVNLAEAIATKRVYGNYRIKSFNDDSVTVVHVKTNKTKVLLVEDSATITAQINFNRDLFNKYAEKALMGQLNVEISNQAASVMPSPQSVVTY